MSKYDVKIESAYGVCESPLFQKMATKGDIQADKIDKMVDLVVNIKGWAKAHITTDEKEFDLYYYATDDGYFSSGSEYFNEGVVDYLVETEKFIIKKVKTKKGFTYKATPIVEDNNVKE